MSGTYPYSGRFEVNRTLPDKGRPREDVLAELHAMAAEEDAFWETGKCSGTMYCGVPWTRFFSSPLIQAVPKSISLMRQDLDRMMFDGFRSPW